MPYEVIALDSFRDWYAALDEPSFERVNALVEVLERRGPALGRPKADRIESSRHHNMKELREGTIRILFAFDPKREAVLILGGDKRDRWEEWYEEAIPLADDLYDEYLRGL